MPLALVEVVPSSAPLDKGKRVVEVVSDDEDSAEGQVFKRQRTQHAPQTVTSATSSSHGAESLREDPPSATSPPQPLDLEGGVETGPTGVPPPAPELPLPMQDSLRGFLGRASPGGHAERPQRESLYYYMGAFMSYAHSWHTQARAKVVQASIFQALGKEVASLKEEKERLATHWGCQEDTYKTSLKVAQKAKEGLAVLLWPQHRSKARRAYLNCTRCPCSRRDLLWVSSAYLDTWDKSRALVPTPMERPIQSSSYSPWSV